MIFKTGTVLISFYLFDTFGISNVFPNVRPIILPDQWKSNLDRRDLLAIAQSIRLQNLPGNDRPLYALPSLFHTCQNLSTQTGPPSPTVLNQATKTINDGGDFSQSTLDSSSTFFHFDNPDQYAHAIGIGAQLLAVIGTALDPAAAVTLGVVGVFAEDAWRAAAEGRNLTENPFIEAAPPQETTYNTKALLFAGASADDTNQTFQGMVDSPLLKEKLGIDLSASAESSFQSLPESFKKFAQDAYSVDPNASQLNAEKQNQITTSIVENISAQCADLEQQAKKYQDSLNQNASEKARQAQRQQLAFLQSQVQSGIQIATFVLGRVLGNSETAKQIGSGLSQVATVGFALASGNYLGAVAAGLQIFDSLGPNPQTVLLQAVQQLGKRIDDLRKEIEQEFNQLEVQNKQIINALSQLLKDVQLGTQSLGDQIQKLQNEVELFKNQDDEEKRNDCVGTVLTGFSQFKKVLKGQYTGWQNDCLKKFPIFVRVADDYSRQPYYCGSIDDSSVGQIATEVRVVSRSDLLVGLLPSICNKMHVSSPNRLVSPFAWSLGVEAYLQADLLIGSVVNNGREDDLQKLFQDGVDLRAGLASITSKPLLSALANAHRTVTGNLLDNNNQTLLGAISPFLKEWESQNFKPRYTVDSLGQFDILAPPFPEIAYYPSFGGDSDEVLRVHNSPVDVAVSLGILELRVVSDEMSQSWGNPIRVITYAVVPKIGPDAGKVFDDGKSTWVHTIYTKRFAPAESFSWNSRIVGGTPPPHFTILVAPTPAGASTTSFLDYCERLLGFHYASQVLPGLPAWLRPRIAKTPALSPWADIASSGVLCVNVAQWRKSDGPELKGQTDLRNVGLLKDVEAVLDWLADTLQTEADALNKNPASGFDTADPRPLNVATRILERLKSDAAKIASSGDGLVDSKSVPVVDATLRRLGGYMTVKGITIPVPPAVTGRIKTSHERLK